MVAKKNILEKLGLIEPVEEEYDDLSSDLYEEASQYSLETEERVPEEPIGVQQEEIIHEETFENLLESYERDRLMTVEDVYKRANLVKSIRDSIYMVDAFVKALPENLPVEVKRQSVQNILKASEMNVEELLSDAYNRVDALNAVMEQTVQATEDINSKNESTIRELERRIDELRGDIESRLKFQEAQNSALEYEIHRVINIIDFIKVKK